MGQRVAVASTLQKVVDALLQPDDEDELEHPKASVTIAGRKKRR